MAKIAIGIYTLEIAEVETSTGRPLDSFDGETDALKVVKRYLDDLQQSPLKDRQQKVVSDLRHPGADGRILSGIFRTGDYGYEADLFDVESDRVSHRQKRSEARMMPFYFQVFIPRGVNRGLAALQRFGTQGIRGAFLEPLRRRFKTSHPGYQLNVGSPVDEQFIKNMVTGGKLKGLNFVKRSIPAEWAAQLRDGPTATHGRAIISLKPEFKGDFPVARIKEWIRGRRAITSILEFPNFEYDTVEAVVSAGREVRKVDLSNFLKAKVYYDVTDRVETGADGHPTLKSIHAEATTLVRDSALKMGLA